MISLSRPQLMLPMVLLISLAASTAHASPFRDAPGTFTQNLSNTTPLVLGMSIADAARALATPLLHVKGRPGDETLLTIRQRDGGGLFERTYRLYLQFRKGRLTGWKADWGTNVLW